MCTLCRSLMQPEMEYDCENARYSQPGVRAPPGLSTNDQKVGKGLGSRVFYVRQPFVPTEVEFFFPGGWRAILGGGLCDITVTKCLRKPTSRRTGLF